MRESTAISTGTPTAPRRSGSWPSHVNRRFEIAEMRSNFDRSVTAAGDLRRRLGEGSTRVPLVGAASLVGGPSGVFPRIASGLGGLKDPVRGGGFQHGRWN